MLSYTSLLKYFNLGLGMLLFNYIAQAQTQQFERAAKIYESKIIYMDNMPENNTANQNYQLHELKICESILKSALEKHLQSPLSKASFRNYNKCSDENRVIWSEVLNALDEKEEITKQEIEQLLQSMNQKLSQ